MKNAKHLIAMLLAFTLILSIMPCGMIQATAEDSSETPVLAVTNVYAFPGSEISVAITIRNNPGILGMTLKLEYDESVAELIDIQSGDALAYMTFTRPQNLHSGVRLPWDALDVNPETIHDGTVAVLTFAIAEKAVIGQSMGITLSYDSGAIIDENVKPLNVDIEQGVVNIIDYMYGDLNSDSLINTTDVVLLRRFIAGGYNVTITEPAADVNRDGSLNTTDVVIIRRYIAGGYNIDMLPVETECAHSMITVSAKEASCTENGNIAYWECTKCGKYFADAKGTVAVLYEATVIPAKGHTLEVIPAVNPTYTENGWTEGSRCSVCGTVLVEPTKIDVLVLNSYSITYDIAGSDRYLMEQQIDNPNPTSYTVQDEIELQNISVPGYYFVGWFDEITDKRVYEIIAGTEGKIRLKAKWTKLEYRIDYKLENAIQSENNVDTYTVTDLPLTLGAPSKGTMLFNGWYDKGTGEPITQITVDMLGDITLEPRWTVARNIAHPYESIEVPAYDRLSTTQDGDNYFFLYYLGYLSNVPLNIAGDTEKIYLQPNSTADLDYTTKHVSSSNVTNSITNETQYCQSWANSKEQVDSYTKQIETAVDAKATVQFVEINAHLGFSATQQDTTTTAHTATQGQTDMNSWTKSDSFTVGWETESKKSYHLTEKNGSGWYRFVPMGTVDIFAVINYNSTTKTVSYFNLEYLRTYDGYQLDYSQYSGFDEKPGSALDFDVPVINIADIISTIYTVSYNLNLPVSTSGIARPGNQLWIQDYTYSLPSLESPTGYTFTGWYTDASCTEKVGNEIRVENQYETQATNIGEPLELVTLYAGWQMNSYTVTFDYAGGTGPYESCRYNYGDTVDYPIPDPTRAGYNFTGWTFDGTDGFAFGNQMPARNIIATANWDYKSAYYDSGDDLLRVDASYEYDRDYFSISDLTAFLNSEFTLHFYITVAMREYDDGYQEVYLVNSYGTKVAGNGSFEHGPGKLDKNWTTEQFWFDVNGANCTDEMHMCYGAWGTAGDDWGKGRVTVTVTVSKN